MQKLDEKDRKIINLLQENCELNTKQIAHEINLSVTPTYERIKRIQKEGLIRKKVALVDRKKVGKDLIVFCNISLKQHLMRYVNEFEEKVKNLDQVMECHHIGGDYDYLLKIAVHDIEEYRAFLTQEFSNFDSISKINSSFAMKEVCFKTAVRL
ncbi:HTH-type transcriptional regulator Ptr2 [Flavobacteriaceae bacterium UJ101]|nr:HTH-type transcriptional regulator Ptr2 [Flavobacteriaceae bacterium UJ101]